MGKECISEARQREGKGFGGYRFTRHVVGPEQRRRLRWDKFYRLKRHLSWDGGSINFDLHTVAILIEAS
jgi:hypothetical protein